MDHSFRKGLLPPDVTQTQGMLTGRLLDHSTEYVCWRRRFINVGRKAEWHRGWRRRAGSSLERVRGSTWPGVVGASPRASGRRGVARRRRRAAGSPARKRVRWLAEDRDTRRTSRTGTPAMISSLVHGPATGRRAAIGCLVPSGECQLTLIFSCQKQVTYL